MHTYIYLQCSNTRAPRGVTDICVYIMYITCCTHVHTTTPVRALHPPFPPGQRKINGHDQSEMCATIIHQPAANQEPGIAPIRVPSLVRVWRCYFTPQAKQAVWLVSSLHPGRSPRRIPKHLWAFGQFGPCIRHPGENSRVAAQWVLGC